MSDIFEQVKQGKQGESAAGGTARAAGRAVGHAQPLGNNTKSRAAFEVREDENPDVIHRLTLDPVRRELVPEIDQKLAVSSARAARYAAQGGATKLLFNHLTPRETQWRVTGCSRRKVADCVGVLYSKAIGKAHYGGLMICGSVWTCPICAAKISELRKIEIQQATDLHKAAGGALYMVTLTFSHQRCDDIASLLKRLAKARMHLRASRGYKNLRAEFGYVGDIRALEVTYGNANGWHPHEHGLWLVSDLWTDKQLRKFRKVLFTLWSKSCKAACLGAPNRARGVNVIEMDSAADYIAKFGREPKWGVGSELAKQHIKVSKDDKRFTPFDLLRAYHLGDARMGALFIEYALAFFGKRQIIWSDGLKKLFGIGEVSDEEHAAAQEQDALLMVKITAPEWRMVLGQPYDVRGLILDLAESGGLEAVRLYLDGLRIHGAPF